MEEKRAGYSLKAPGNPGPDRGLFPCVDDHLVQAEVTRDEIIGGRLVVAEPAEPSKATKHSILNYVLRAHLAPGYHGASDLLTRFDHHSDFAFDACAYKDGIDPETGARYLQEVAFEVLSEQNESLVTEKAGIMHRRGVRRIFTVWVDSQTRVCEWSPDSQGWRPLPPESSIDEPCFATPLPIAALLDKAAADNAVVRALAAKRNPVLQEREAAAETRGVVEGETAHLLRNPRNAKRLLESITELEQGE